MNTGGSMLFNVILHASVVFALAPFDGVTLFNPINGVNANRTELIDNDGNVLQQWIGAEQIAGTPYLVQGGILLRPCRASGTIPMEGSATGGRIQKFSFEGELLWDFTLSNEHTQPHHDICQMPNGNLLLIAWDHKTQSEAENAGRLNLNTEFWPEQILEIMPIGPTSGEIVWEWHLWDHIIQDISPALPNYGVISEHPEKLDINKGTLLQDNGDWIHANALDYNPALDQIVFGSNTLDEIFIIDHGITSEEAAGAQGDFLYRWGNPGNYERNGEHVLYNVHGINWVDDGLLGAGNLLLINNSYNDQASDVIEFVPPLRPDGTYDISPYDPYGPTPGEYVFYYESSDFFGQNLCGVYRLPNGNTLATNGPGRELRELNSDGEIEWQHFTQSTIMRAVKYPHSILDPIIETCVGDTNQDGSVNVTDVLLAVGDWGQSDSPADVNGDGIVNVSDLLTIIDAWGSCQ